MLDVRNPFSIAAERLNPNSLRNAQDRERADAMGDVRTFARHCHIQEAEGQDGSFAAVGWRWQFILLWLWSITKLSVVLKARQLGVSWLAAIYALWCAMRKPNQAILLISRRQDDADKLLAKVKYVWEHLPEWRTGAVVATTSVRFANGSSIESMPATENIGRSRTANLVILDEWAHQPNARHILQAVHAATETGQILGISSANGQGALHSQIYIKSKGGPLSPVATPDGTILPMFVTPDALANGWRGIFIPYNAHPARDAAWRVQKRLEVEELSDADFTQEYPADDVEAIQTTGRPVFRPEDITRQPIERGLLDQYGNTLGEAGLTLYRQPVAGAVYCIGADVGEGLSTSDWSSATVFDRDSGEQVAQLRGRWAPDVYAAKLDRLARRYAIHNSPTNRRPVIVGIERNNHGHAAIQAIVVLMGNNCPYALAHMTGEGVKKRAGWLTTNANRPVLVDQLEAALRTGAVTLHDAGTVDQFASFAFNEEGRPEAVDGYHDDDVFAAGIAWQVRRRSFGRVLGIVNKEAAA